MTVLSSWGLIRILLKRVRRLAARDVDVGDVPPALPAVVSAIQLVADDAGGERADRAAVARAGSLMGGGLGFLVFEQRVEHERVLLINVDTDAPILPVGRPPVSFVTSRRRVVL